MDISFLFICRRDFEPNAFFRISLQILCYSDIFKQKLKVLILIIFQTHLTNFTSRKTCEVWPFQMSTTTFWHNFFHNLMTCVIVIGESLLSYRLITFSLLHRIVAKKILPVEFPLKKKKNLMVVSFVASVFIYSIDVNLPPVNII